MRLHGVLGGAVKRLDAQILFDPFEEQLDLPAATIKLRDGQRRQVEIVGQEDQVLVVFGIVEFDTPQVLRVILGLVVSGQRNGLVAA